MRQLLSFGHGNAKLDAAIFTFSLPAGYTCPGALLCLSRADRDTGTVTDGPATAFRCFAASQEARHRSVRDSRWRNLALLRRCKTAARMAALILDSLTPYAGTVRVHVSGDFYSQHYFDAWLIVARQRPRTLFYAYTKAIPFWLARQDDIPDNLVLTASYGGRHDGLIAPNNLRSALVVGTEAEAQSLGLPIDHDDRLAMDPAIPRFALLIHGMQPPGSHFARAVQGLRDRGWYGYGPSKGRLSLPTVN